MNLENFTSDQRKALSHFREGVNLFKHNDLEGALLEFDQSLEFDSKNSHIFQFRALCKALLYVPHPDLTIDEMRPYASEVVSDLETALQRIKSHFRI